jgi:hypothetical protein
MLNIIFSVVKCRSPSDRIESTGLLN